MTLVESLKSNLAKIQYNVMTVWGRLKVLVPSSGLFSRIFVTLDGLEANFVTVNTQGLNDVLFCLV